MNITKQEALRLIDEKPSLFSGIERHIVVQFKSWVQMNEHVLQAFEKYAIDLKRRGNRENYSINCIIQRLRWDELLRSEGEKWKLNNNYCPVIARILMALNAELRNMFQLRNRY